MSSGSNGSGPLDDESVERSLRASLRANETVAQRLVNTRVGLTRDDGTVETIEPGDDCGAVAAVTDERILFVVGDPPARDNDFTASVGYEDLEAVERRTETLTRALVVETTAGVRWRFTARRAAAVDDAIETVERQLAERTLADARDHHEAAKTASDPAECAESLETALDAYRRAAELLGDERRRVTTAEREAREDAEAVIAGLIAAQREHGEQRLAAAEWERAADNDASAYELLVEATEAYDRALDLARAYPPGDPETIGRERADVIAALEPLKVEFAVAGADDDEERQREGLL